MNFSRVTRSFVLFSTLSIACITASNLIAVPATAASLETPPAVSFADEAFYLPPAELSHTPGTVIRREPMNIYASVPNMEQPGAELPWPGKAERIMYTSTTANGDPVAVTGMRMLPSAPWLGAGPRPLVVFGSGTIGQGDQCAPSKLAPTMMQLRTDLPSFGINYELIFANLLLQKGVSVVMTDYIGMGTPGVHTYMNRLDQGHAMLDAARAGQNLATEDLIAADAVQNQPSSQAAAPADLPIGFWGYSQGGGASASAAELAETYAPELNVQATYAGAPPADLVKVAHSIESNVIVGALGYATNGLIERYPSIRDEMDDILTPVGHSMLEATSTQCIADSIFRYGLLGAGIPRATTALTKDGRTLDEHLTSNPGLRTALAEQRIGTLRPKGSVLVVSNVNDDAIPYAQVKQLVNDWRDLGGSVEFTTRELPSILPNAALGHMLPLFASFTDARDWFLDKFNQ